MVQCHKNKLMDLHLMEVNMKYKNIKTGVVLETTSKIIGKAWVPLDEALVTKTEEPAEEYVEEEIDLEEMTKAELVEFSKEHDIKVNERDTKNKIIETIAKHFD